jgi:HD-GYP domain-containing protein (c-di-GMP phosphodiesterase class II)/tRNA A-37 threonylcarbamoyl transferase component Bud32
MNPHPTLRTGRAGPTAAGSPARALDPVLDHPGLPAAARDLLQDLIDLRLTDPPAVEAFLGHAADKVPGLTSRDRTGRALARAGLLTAYQRDRVIAGSTFGLVLGPYRVLDRLGGGSVGVVFLGEHVLLRRRVALKVLPVDDAVRPELRDRFHAEMRILAGLDHPNVVAAHDAGVLPAPAPGQPSLHYLVLELVPGGDLEQYVYNHGPPPVAQACEWARQTAAGLQAAHDHHLVHRDLKPSNLLLTGDGRIKLVDFGLARQLASTITRQHTLLGSVEFMAPEQAQDATAVGPPADVYGLGATVFWVLTGQLPFPRGRTPLETLQSIRTGKPRRARELRPEVPAEVDDLIARMLARSPCDRPTAVEVMRGLSPFAHQPEPVEPEPPPEAEPAEAGDSRVVRLRETVRQLEGCLRARDDAVRKAQGAVLYAMAKMAESHDGETEGHLRRMQEYVRVLATELTDHPDWVVLQDDAFVAELIRCVPLHDIGKIGLPDVVLGKPAALTAAERRLVERHPVTGSEVLDALGREHGESLTFLGVARSVVRHHHERWDGTGYPDRLAGEEIPPAARLVAVADVYDALRRDRPDRSGVGHEAAAACILDSTGQFDPAVLDAFRNSQNLFEEIYQTMPD